MRENKFRGQSIKGEWHYGLLCHDKTKDTDYEWFISNSAGKPYAFGVVEDTIGRFTDLTDKNGKEIYEGKNSIKLTLIGIGEGFADVLMKDGMWQVYEISNGYAPLFDLLKNQSIEILSNDNPEMKN